ncbi:type I-F CRISPR-associated endoribonuclease Cas6/Csy4 [Geovibrio thiophilus]|uniref:Type I-F CRISPR-associated endoribonuclease Cas6/Csy4 n=1 Tax=Geovibrio thiophilus TaxID=139438 RepID=A0A3R5UV74_9BACT|nr:type I-F CRISPR-associated endoribonuclease Cas6/Csy4 [Geovibrio thiophilus]QAR33493.1 type I-F CRISPR-associated endoribonuclease Cas6/Csy4 [Geovibrio thiophilus]
MRFYADLRVRENPEITPQVILNMLFEKLHLVLAEQVRGDVGISFPDVKNGQKNLGKVLRVHGEKEALESVVLHPAIERTADYAEIGRIRQVPDNAAYCIVSRVQAKSSPERLRRRSIKKFGMSEEEAMLRVPDSKAKMLELPFITLNSKSTGQKFRLYIRHEEASNSGNGKGFSTYGLSAVSAVPWF